MDDWGTAKESDGGNADDWGTAEESDSGNADNWGTAEDDWGTAKESDGGNADDWGTAEDDWGSADDCCWSLSLVVVQKSGLHLSCCPKQCRGPLMRSLSNDLMALLRSVSLLRIFIAHRAALTSL